MPSRLPSDSLADIVEPVDLVAAYVGTADCDAFSADMKTRHAVERCLSIIGEAASRLGEDAAECSVARYSRLSEPDHP